MSFSENKEKQLKQMPVVKTSITKSKTGKYLIHKTEIVTVKPMVYYEAIVKNEEKVNQDADLELATLMEEN